MRQILFAGASLGSLGAACLAPNDDRGHASSLAAVAAAAAGGDPSPAPAAEPAAAAPAAPAPAAPAPSPAAAAAPVDAAAIRAEAATAERARIKAIVGCDAAKGRETLAAHLAFDTAMEADAAVKALDASPKSGNAQALAAMAGDQPDLGASGGQPAPAASDFDQGAQIAQRHGKAPKAPAK